jgi:pimeloyl-ACP methyl ester carboxylesterase
MEITPVHDLNPQCTSTNPELVVIFFHGIGYGENDDWKETWTSTTSDGKRVCWPQEWLPADLGTKNVNNVRILSLSYDSALLGANEHVTDIGKNLVESLVSKREYEPLWEAPIVLVGYSFGGLVVKSLIVEADKRAKARIVNPLDKRAKLSCTKFLENLKGTIFYGVPHTGGGADFKQYFVYQSQRLNDLNGEEFAKSGILKNMEGFNKQMADLSIDFENAADPALIIYAFGEGKPVKRGQSVLVPFASAQQLARRNHYKVEDATHITICQPISRQAINYSRLKDVLAIVMEGTQTRSTPESTHAPSQQSTYAPSQLRLPDPDSKRPSSSNRTPELDKLL